MEMITKDRMRNMHTNMIWAEDMTREETITDREEQAGMAADSAAAAMAEITAADRVRVIPGEWEWAAAEFPLQKWVMAVDTADVTTLIRVMRIWITQAADITPEVLTVTGR